MYDQLTREAAADEFAAQFKAADDFLQSLGREVTVLATLAEAEQAEGAGDGGEMVCPDGELEA